jgi:hypothetical protein
MVLLRQIFPNFSGDGFITTQMWGQRHCFFLTGKCTLRTTFYLFIILYRITVHVLYSNLDNAYQTRTLFITSLLLSIYCATVIVTWIFLVLKKLAAKYFVTLLLLVVFWWCICESVCVLEVMDTPSRFHKVEICRCGLKSYCCSLLCVGSNMLVIVYIFLPF